MLKNYRALSKLVFRM